MSDDILRELLEQLLEQTKRGYLIENWERVYFTSLGHKIHNRMKVNEKYVHFYLGRGMGGWRYHLRFYTEGIDEGWSITRLNPKWDLCDELWKLVESLIPEWSEEISKAVEGLRCMGGQNNGS